MRSFFLLCGLTATAAMGQSMLEVGGIVAGSSVGSAAGKKLSDSLNSTLKKTAATTEKAAKSDPDQKAELEKRAEQEKAKSKQQPPQTVPAPPPVDPAFLPTRPGGGSSEAYNVPPPPPPAKKRVPAQPVRAARPSTPTPIVPVRYEAPPKPEPLNVDLVRITLGMQRDEVLTFGKPSARITMYDSGHLVEIYSYRNATYVSGSVRLQDGAVTSVDARP